MFQGPTAPSFRVRDGSVISLESSMSLTIPVPLQREQAPPLLKESSSADCPSNSAPHSGHTIFRPMATAGDGGTRCPFGHV